MEEKKRLQAERKRAYGANKARKETKRAEQKKNSKLAANEIGLAF
jgi:hypothetical protein